MTLTITNPDLEAMGLTEGDVLLELALSFFAAEKLTLGQASRLAKVGPASFIEALLTRQNLSADVRRHLAIEGYRNGDLTAALAAQLAGLSQWEFRQLFEENDLYVNYDVEELEKDLETLRRLGRP